MSGPTYTQIYYRDGTLRKTDYANADTPDVTLVYDSYYNRLATQTDGAGTWIYSYHPTSTAPSHPSSVNGAGQLSSIDGPWAEDTMLYTYDDWGRLTSRNLNTTTYTNQTWSESVTYDSLGRQKSTTNAMGTWDFSFVGNSGLVDKISTSVSGAVQEVDYNYFAASQGRFLQQILNRKTVGGTVISQHDYTYGTGSEFGQIKTWQRQLPLTYTSGSYSTTTQTFGYDVIGQLRSGAETGLPTRTFDYDPAGNRTAKSEGGTGTANDINQILTATGGDAATSLYDSNGNLTSIVYGDGSRRILVWNSINRLKQLTIQAGTSPTSGDKRVEFTYNAASQRVTQSLATFGVSTWGAAVVDYYRWDGDSIIQVRSGSSSSSSATSYYPQGTRDHAAYSNSDSFFTRDHLGSVYEVLQAATGYIMAAYTYSPYGERTTRFGSSNNQVAYTGHFFLQPSTATHQAAGQLSLTWYRAYDPNTGIWLNRDPIEEAGGLNLYEMVNNNSINNFDPYGLFPWGFASKRVVGAFAPSVGGSSVNYCSLSSEESHYIGTKCVYSCRSSTYSADIGIVWEEVKFIGKFKCCAKSIDGTVPDKEPGLHGKYRKR